MIILSDSCALIITYLGEGCYNQIVINKEFVKKYKNSYKSETSLKTSSINIDILKYSISCGCPISTYLGKTIALNGNLECLIYIYERRHSRTTSEDLALYAIIGGHLECLKYLHHEKKCKLIKHFSEYAARYGHLECLKYLHEYNCPWDWMTCSWAAENGHLDCLKYLHENGCPWGARACYRATIFGHYECLVYLHENGCKWDCNTIHFALKCNRTDCLEYARAHGCPEYYQLLVDI